MLKENKVSSTIIIIIVIIVIIIIIMAARKGSLRSGSSGEKSRKKKLERVEKQDEAENPENREKKCAEKVAEGSETQIAAASVEDSSRGSEDEWYDEESGVFGRVYPSWKSTLQADW